MLSGVGISDTELRYIEFIYIHYCNKWKKKVKLEKTVYKWLKPRIARMD